MGWATEHGQEEADVFCDVSFWEVDRLSSLSVVVPTLLGDAVMTNMVNLSVWCTIMGDSGKFDDKLNSQTVAVDIRNDCA